MNMPDTDTPKHFVIQRHSRAKDAHWDLMLEGDGVLLTWRLNVPPHKISIDHPLRFLTYQGPVQNGTGCVRIVDGGVYQPANETSDRIELTLTGRVLNGPFMLERAAGTLWRLTPAAK